MDNPRIIHAPINTGRRYGITSPITQYDYGYLLLPEGVELPTTYEIDFSNDEKHGTSFTVYGNSEGAEVPEVLIRTGKDVFAFYYEVGEGYGKTDYTWRIPNHCRPDRDGGTPTPSQQSSIDQLIVRSNEAVTSAEQSASDASASAQSAQGYAEQAETAKTNAQTYTNNAQTSATQASTSASQASTSATASAQSASQSAQIKSDVEGMVSDAQGYAESASQSASASAQSASDAQGYAQSASTSETNAQGYASQAQTSANTASGKAQDASTSAQTASNKASEASQSASQALSYKTGAESAKTASQTAQGLAESARDSAVQAKTDAESAKADAESARDEAVQAVASISGALDDKADIITDTASGSIASFSDGADDLPLKSLVVDINPVQDLHGQDAPYPAGGGKNLFGLEKWLSDNDIEYTKSGDSYTFSLAVGLFTRPFVFSETDTEVTLSFESFSNGTSVNARMTLLDSSNSAIRTIYADSANLKTTGTACKVRMDWQTGGAGTVTIKAPQIEFGSTATSYAPYENICPISGWTQINVNHSDADTTNPTIITISLGQTVYGGKLDVLSGELTVYPYYASYNGETLTGEWISDRDKYVSETTPTIGAQVVNIGAQGVTVQLEPHEVESLYGVNNIWADSGDTSCEYRADTKLFIERLTAPDSEDMIADANITSGQYFMVGNTLYKATANIANGSAIIVGTNCIRKSLSEALNEINA